MTSSATERELLKGELKTQTYRMQSGLEGAVQSYFISRLDCGLLLTPCLAAASRSTWLVPIQKQPMAINSLAASRTCLVNLVLERIPIT